MQQKQNVVRVKKMEFTTLNTENKILSNNLLKLISSNSSKKKICLKDRKIIYGKNKNVLSVKKNLKRMLLKKCGKLFTYKNVVSSLKKHEKKKMFKNKKILSIYLKTFFLLNWLKNKPHFSKVLALKTLYKKYTKNKPVKHVKKDLKTKINFEQKNFKKSMDIFSNFLYKSKKKNYNNFIPTFYGNILFKPLTVGNIGYKNSIDAFDRLSFFRSIFRSDIYSQLLKKDNRFVPDKFRNQSIFKILGNDWMSKKINPWLDSLVFKRDLYTGSTQRFNKYTNLKYISWRNYLRYKNPRREKKNRLYNRYLFLLPSQKTSVIQLNKKARIKKIVSKLILPLYGHLNEKQFNKIVKKNRYIKSSTQNKLDSLFSKFEMRLDVVVFRLNLAPNIMWARRMIQSGNVFVSSRENSKIFDGIQGLKKNSFPLKLRDPKNLYIGNRFKYFAKKYKNFIAPVKNPNYVLNIGDMVQCSKMSLMQGMSKTNKYLFKKPVPKHLLSLSSGKVKWNKYKILFKKNKENSIAAVMLFKPNFDDISYRDRSNENFFKWMVL
jgi:ribosomal protein S4